MAETGKLKRTTWMVLIWLATVTNIFAQPAGQPDQIISPVQYDAKLSDPFFSSNEWSYPVWVIDHGNGYVETTSGEKIPETESMHLRHTANCTTNQQYEGTYLIHSDLDNYARLTGFVYLKSGDTKRPGLEAFFVIPQ